LQDSKSGLAAGAKLKYGWSTSTSTAPSSYTDVIPSYTAGTTSEVTFTASASGLTGKYYLWVVPTTLADTAGNTQTATVKSTGQFYFDNQGPSAPTITGGSTTYATSRTISVSTASTDSHVGTVSKYEYYYTSSSTAPTASTSATGTVSTTTTSQTFASNMKAYYVYFRGVDSLGNKGTWSSAQRLYIDVNSPTVSAKNSSVTITKGDNVAMSTYFTTSANGNAAISSTVYKIGSASYTNTSSLATGSYTVTCTVTKVGGKTASASMTLIVKAKGTAIASKVAIGDYVSYPVTYTNVNTYGSGYASTATGWRVVYISGNTVKIATAGTPLTYTHSTSISASYSAMTTNFKTTFSSFYNSCTSGNAAKFTSAVSAFGRTEVEIIMGKSVADNQGAGSWPVLCNGSMWWIVSSSAVSGTSMPFQNGGNNKNDCKNGAIGRTHGVRPMVTLKTDTVITGGSRNFGSSMDNRYLKQKSSATVVLMRWNEWNCTK